ncbi:RNase H domain-containing protein [Trichonephila clavipes]|nr:RNase H domain-containing protein [Trichonephila clavipes]
MAIDTAADCDSERHLTSEIWFLSGARSAIQYLNNWGLIGHNRGINIIDKLRTLSGSAMIHQQSIKSHVNLKYNDLANDLTKGSTSMAQVNEKHLTYLELYSKC